MIRGAKVINYKFLVKKVSFYPDPWRFQQRYCKQLTKTFKRNFRFFSIIKSDPNIKDDPNNFDKVNTSLYKISKL